MLPLICLEPIAKSLANTVFLLTFDQERQRALMQEEEGIFDLVAPNWEPSAFILLPSSIAYLLVTFFAPKGVITNSQLFSGAFELFPENFNLLIGFFWGKFAIRF